MFLDSSPDYRGRMRIRRREAITAELALSVAEYFGLDTQKTKQHIKRNKKWYKSPQNMAYLDLNKS